MHSNSPPEFSIAMGEWATAKRTPRKGRRFKKANKYGMEEDRARYLDIEQMVKRELQDAERVYVNGILQNGLESGNNKPF